MYVAFLESYFASNVFAIVILILIHEVCEYNKIDELFVQEVV